MSILSDYSEYRAQQLNVVANELRELPKETADDEDLRMVCDQLGIDRDSITESELDYIQSAL